MSIKAVIFDLDGTLLNSLDDIADALNYALKSAERSPLALDRVRRFVGNGVPKLIERALDFTGGGGADAQRCFDECLERFKEYYDVHNADKTKPYVGAADMLRSLKALGVKTAINTNKYDGAARALKDRFFGDADAVVGASPDVRPKPSPDGALKALRMLGVSAADAIYVGDGETDIATARNSGLMAVAVTWGFRDRAELEALKPDFMIDAPNELVPTLAAAGLIDIKAVRRDA
ncbi:MAG: HAD-IA family hydrolase [Roseburia sp.]|nr:HAD-IA family hydrolase [Roseburia sp.]